MTAEWITASALQTGILGRKVRNSYRKTFNLLYLFSPPKLCRGTEDLDPTEVWWDPEHSGGCWRARGWPGNSVLSLTDGNIFCQCSQTNADTQPLFQSFMLEHVKLLRIPQSLEKIPIIYVTSNNRGLPSYFSLRTWSYQVGVESIRALHAWVPFHSYREVRLMFTSWFVLPRALGFSARHRASLSTDDSDLKSKDS